MAMYTSDYDPYSSSDNAFWLTGTDAAQSRVTDFIEDVSHAEDGTANRQGNAGKNVYKHVPHNKRPPLIVARRNARERRRVEAVNCAFTRLRKAVPITNSRGKRISKVKTLQTAIEYIIGLEMLLKQAEKYYHMDIIPNYRYHSEDFIQVLDNFGHDF